MNTLKSDFKLSIAIPTSNGEKYLAAAIESIFDQFDERLFKDIEVVVLNNASTDNSLETIRKYLINNKIRVHTHDKNIGFDNNIISAFHICKGEYILFLGDDDYLEPKCVSKIMSVISEGDYSALLMPVSFHNTLTDRSTFSAKYRNDVTFSNISDFLNHTEFDSSCISSLCFKRIKLEKLSIEQHIKSNWIHVAILIETVATLNKVYCFHENMVNVRIHNNRWENNFGNQLLSGLTHLCLLKSYYENKYIDKAVYEKLSALKYKQNFRAIVGLKPKLIKDQFQSALIMIQLYYNKINLWVLHIPLLILPNPAFRLILNIYRACKFGFLYIIPRS